MRRIRSEKEILREQCQGGSRCHEQRQGFRLKREVPADKRHDQQGGGRQYDKKRNRDWQIGRQRKCAIGKRLRASTTSVRARFCK